MQARGIPAPLPCKHRDLGEADSASLSFPRSCLSPARLSKLTRRAWVFLPPVRKLPQRSRPLGCGAGVAAARGMYAIREAGGEPLSVHPRTRVSAAASTPPPPTVARREPAGAATWLPSPGGRGQRPCPGPAPNFSPLPSTDTSVLLGPGRWVRAREGSGGWVCVS